MAKDRVTDKLAVILHADIAGSTQLVQTDEQLAHERIRETFDEFAATIKRYSGRVLELRGDALLAEFERPSDAVSASLAFQSSHKEFLSSINDTVKPRVRIGISMGEVVIADGTVTGAGVVLAQRVEQLADPGGACVTAAVREALSRRLPIELENLGERELKGFDEPIRVFRLVPAADGAIPPPQPSGSPARPMVSALRTALLLTIVAAVVLGVFFSTGTDEPASEKASLEAMQLPLPDKPSIAVLPFNNMSADAEQEYFVDGMTEDLITDLSKLSGLFVVARNTVFTYKDKAVKVNEVAEELGVRYVLEGSARRAGDQVRINAQLIDALSGGHIWADRYDGVFEDVFALQDDVVRSIVAELKLNLSIEDDAAISSADTADSVAYDIFLRGWELYQTRDPSKYAAAIGYFEQAIDRDPGFSRAHSALAALYLDVIKKGWWQQSLGMAYHSVFERGRIALRQAQRNPAALTHQIVAEWHASFSNRARLSIEAAERALELNPNHPASHMAMASALLKDSRAREAETFIRAAMRLNPSFPPVYLVSLAQAQFQLGNYSDAADSLERAVAQDPNDHWAYTYLAASYGKLEQRQKAQKALARANALRADAGFAPVTEVATAGWGFRHNWRGKRSALKQGLSIAGAPRGGEWYSRITQRDGRFEIKGVTTINANEAKALHERGVIFIDMERGWYAHRIPGAYFLDWGGSEGWLYNEIGLKKIADETDEIVIYTSLGGDFGRWAANASAFTASRGFEKVYLLQTGLDGWKRAGYPVDTSKVE